MIVGLTGGIGSGKSTVARLFELMGFAVFNSDLAAKEVYFDAETRQKITALLGSEAYLSNTAINKAYIGSRIFSDAALLKDVNSIIHPAVREKFLAFVKKHPNQIVIKETALLFEAAIDKEVDVKLIVAANDDLRIKRVMQRDGLSREEVQKKINSQWLQEDKIKLSDFVIYNNEDQFLITQVLTIVSSLKTHLNGHAS